MRHIAILLFLILTLDFSFAGSVVDVFKTQLRDNPPIKWVRFSIVESRGQKKAHYYVAAANREDFFIREYLPSEDVSIPISFANPVGGYITGQSGDLCWNINATTITKAYLSDPKVNVQQLTSKHARENLDSLLTFGLSFLEKGSFSWNDNFFKASAAKDVTLTPDGFNGPQLREISGKITVEKERVSNLAVDIPKFPLVRFEYENQSLPQGIPSKIITFEGGLVFNIDEFEYADSGEDISKLFVPYTHFKSTNDADITLITNGISKDLVTRNSELAFAAQQKAVIEKVPYGRRKAVQVTLLGFLIIPVVLIIIYISSRRKKGSKV